MNPPPFSQILKAYEADDKSKHLRLGQYFFNKYIKHQPVSAPYNFDMLYNSTDYDEILNIIRQMYIDYQWTM